MKAMKKVLALALALAMVVTAVPVTSAKAADISLKAGKSKKITYYVGKTNTVKLTGVTASKVKSTTWSKNGSKALNLKSKAKTSVKVQLVKAGTAKVTASVKLKSGATKKYTVNITVKNPTITAASAKTVAVGDKISVEATGVKPASATVEYSVADPAVATVDAKTGDVTGVKAGTTKVTAKLTCGTTVKEVTTDVTVKNVLLQSVKQTKADTLEATIAGDTKSVKATDIKIVNAETNVVYPVHTVSVDAKDATKVTLTVFSPLTDGKNYDVTLDGVTKSFKATDGAVAAISVDPITIPYATEKEIKLIATDAQGVVLKELAYGTPDTNYDFTINANGNGYTNGSKLYLNKVGVTATAEITYKSGKYDQDGKPVGNIGPNKVTITATAQSEVNNFDVRIDATTATKYEKAKDNKQIPVNESTKNIAYFMIKDTDGTEIGNYGKYTIETSDKTVLMIDDSGISDKKATLTALKTGTAYILIKDTNGNVVNSVAINVVAERAVATLELNTYSVAVSKDLTGDNKVVKATVKDQYGDDFSLSGDLNVECLSAPTGVTLSSTSTFYSIANHKDITFNNSPTVKGTYIYKISYKKDGKEVVAKTVSVEIKKAANTTATSWRLNVVNDGVDIKVDDNNKTSQSIQVALIGMNDGIDVKQESSVNFIVKDPNGVVKFDNITSANAVTNAAISVSSGVLTADALTVSGSTAEQKLSAGTYTVTASMPTSGGKKVEITTNFTIKNTQAKPSVDVKENTVDGGTVEAALKNALVVTYGDDVYNSRSDKATTDKALVITKVEGKRNDGVTINKNTSVTSGNYFTVTKLVVTVEVASGITMDIEVSVPGTITIKN